MLTLMHTISYTLLPQINAYAAGVRRKSAVAWLHRSIVSFSYLQNSLRSDTKACQTAGKAPRLTRDTPSHRRGAARGDPRVQQEVYLFFHKSTDCLNSDLSLSDDTAPVRQHLVLTDWCRLAFVIEQLLLRRLVLHSPQSWQKDL